MYIFVIVSMHAYYQNFEPQSTGVSEWHFEENLGRKVNARLIRAKNGIREFSGILESYEDGVAVIRDEENDMTLSVAKSEAAYVRLQDDFDYSKGEDQ